MRWHLAICQNIGQDQQRCAECPLRVRVMRVGDKASMSLCLFIKYASEMDFSSVQFSRSVVSSCLRPRESQHAGLPVHHQLPEFTQIHVHQVSDAIQPSHPLPSPSPPAPRYIGSGQIGDGKTEHWHFSISELKWTGTGEFNSDDHYISYWLAAWIP